MCLRLRSETEDTGVFISSLYNGINAGKLHRGNKGNKAIKI